MALDEFRCVQTRKLWRNVSVLHDSRAAQSLLVMCFAACVWASEWETGTESWPVCTRTVHRHCESQGSGCKSRNMWITSRGHSLSAESLLSAQCRYECALNANSTTSQPPVNLSAVCRRQMIADNRFAKGSWSHRDQAVLLLCFFHAADSVCSLWSGFA